MRRQDNSPYTGGEVNKIFFFLVLNWSKTLEYAKKIFLCISHKIPYFILRASALSRNLDWNISSWGGVQNRSSCSYLSCLLSEYQSRPNTPKLNLSEPKKMQIFLLIDHSRQWKLSFHQYWLTDINFFLLQTCHSKFYDYFMHEFLWNKSHKLLWGHFVI